MLGPLMPIEQHAANFVVAVAKDIGFDDDRIALHPFDGPASAVDLRRDSFDDNAAAARIHILHHLATASDYRYRVR